MGGLLGRKQSPNLIFNQKSFFFCCTKSHSILDNSWWPSAALETHPSNSTPTSASTTLHGHHSTDTTQEDWRGLLLLGGDDTSTVNGSSLGAKQELLARLIAASCRSTQVFIRNFASPWKQKGGLQLVHNLNSVWLASSATTLCKRSPGVDSDVWFLVCFL